MNVDKLQTVEMNGSYHPHNLQELQGSLSHLNSSVAAHKSQMNELLVHARGPCGADPMAAGNDSWQAMRNATGLSDNRQPGASASSVGLGGPHGGFGGPPGGASTFNIGTPVQSPMQADAPRTAAPGRWFLYDENM